MHAKVYLAVNPIIICFCFFSEDLVLAEERTTEADREMIMDGINSIKDILGNHCNYFSKEETDEASEEDELHQARFSGDQQRGYGGRGVTS